MAESGSHSQLIDMSGVYAGLWNGALDPSFSISVY